MNKKRVFAIILFIAVGLFMFTFANPNEKVNDGEDKKGSQEKVSQPENEETKETVPTIVAPVNVVPANVVPTANVRPVDNLDNGIELAKAKEKAIKDLNDYRKDYVYEDDTDYKKVISDYTDAINNATTIDEVNKALDNGKKAIDDAIDADIEAYKKEAIEKLEEYAENIVLSDKTKKSIVGDGVEAITNDAETKKDVDKALDDAKKALEDAAKELAELKGKAIKELEEYAGNIVLSDKIKELIVAEGIDNINKSYTAEDITKSLEDAKKALDDASYAEMLAKAKEDAKKALEEYAEDVKYNEANAVIVSDYKTTGYSEIMEATTIEQVAQALSDAKANIDTIIEFVLNGEENLTITEKTNYTDAGYTLVSSKYTNEDVKSSSNVNTFVTGEYNVTYVVADITLTRNVSVVAKKLKDIEVKEKEIYIVGQDVPEVYVTAIYDNGEKQQVKATVNPSIRVDQITKRDITVYVTYGEITKPMKYAVIAKKAIKAVPSQTEGQYFLGKKADEITALVTYDNGKTATKVCNIIGYADNKYNVGKHETFLDCDGVKVPYTYQITYEVRLVSGWYGPYLEFGFYKSDKVNIDSIVRYDVNGNAHAINLTNASYDDGWLGNGYYYGYITNQDFDELDKMNGQSKRKLEITYTVGGKTFTSTFTKTIKK